MTSRDLILNQLKEHAQVMAMPAPWVSHREFADLADQFETALTAVHGEVIRTDRLETAVSALAELMTELGVKTAVANSEEPLTSLNLAALFPDIDWHLVEQTPGSLREFCTSADIGISSGDAGPGRNRLRHHQQRPRQKPTGNLAASRPRRPSAHQQTHQRSLHLDGGSPDRPAQQHHPRQRPQQNGRHRANDGYRRARPQTLHRHPLPIRLIQSIPVETPRLGVSHIFIPHPSSFSCYISIFIYKFKISVYYSCKRLHFGFGMPFSEEINGKTSQTSEVFKTSEVYK